MASWKRRIAWKPPADAWAASRMGRFLDRVAGARDLDLSSYSKAWEWSITDLESFWSEVAREFDVTFATESTAVLRAARCPNRAGSPARH